MTLHTIVPLELVLQGMNEEAQTPPHTIEIGGVTMEVVPIAPGMGKIVRLVGCALDDYLRPELAPGMIVRYSE